MGVEQKLYEWCRLDTANANIIEPQTIAAATVSSVWLGVWAYDKVLFICQAGAANDATATLDIQIREATSNAGAGAQNLAPGGVNRAIVQQVAGAGFATFNGLYLIHVEIPEMTVNTGYAFLQVQATVSAADTWLFACCAMRERREYELHPGVPTQTIG